MRAVVELADVEFPLVVVRNGACVIVSIEVVGRREDCNDGGEARGGARVAHVVAVVLGFMCAEDGQHTIAFQELTGRKVCEDIGAPAEAVQGEALAIARREVLCRVGPQDVAHGAVQRRLAEAVDLHNVVNRLEVRGDPPVDAQKLPVDDGAQRECVEGLERHLVHSVVVFALALLFEGEVLCQVVALVVSPDEEDGVPVLDLQRVQVQQHLNGERPPVHVVPKKKILRLPHWTSHLKQSDEVVVLPVNVSTN